MMHAKTGCWLRLEIRAVPRSWIGNAIPLAVAVVPYFYMHVHIYLRARRIGQSNSEPNSRIRSVYLHMYMNDVGAATRVFKV